MQDPDQESNKVKALMNMYEKFVDDQKKRLKPDLEKLQNSRGPSIEEEFQDDEFSLGDESPDELWKEGAFSPFR